MNKQSTPRAGEHGPGADPMPRDIAAPDLGGSFEENGQVRRHDGAPTAVPEESLRAAKEAEKNSSAGS